MGNENGNFISPEKLEQTRRTASYKKDCCKKSTRKKNDLKKGAPKKEHRQDFFRGGKG